MLFPIKNNILKPSVNNLVKVIQSIFRKNKVQENLNNLKKGIIIIQKKFRKKYLTKNILRTHILIKSNKYIKIFIDYDIFAIDIQKNIRRFMVTKKLCERKKGKKTMMKIKSKKMDSGKRRYGGKKRKSGESGKKRDSGEKRYDGKKRKNGESGKKKRRCGICRKEGHTCKKCCETFYHARKYTKYQMYCVLKNFVEDHDNIEETIKKNYNKLIKRVYDIYGFGLYKNYLTKKKDFNERELKRYNLVHEVINRFGDGKNAGFINILKSMSNKYDLNYKWPSPKKIIVKKGWVIK